MTIEIHPAPEHHQVSRLGYAKDSKGTGYLLLDHRDLGVLVQPGRPREDFKKSCSDADAGANVLSTWWYPPNKGEKLPAWPSSVADILEALAWNSTQPRAPTTPSPAPLASSASDEPKIGSLDF